MKPTADPKGAKLTIRGKIFSAFLLVIVITLALLWLAQVVLFDMVYSNVRIDEVKTTARHVKLSLNKDDFYRTLSFAAGKNDMCAEILSSDGSVVYDAENTTTCLIHSLTLSERKELIAISSETLFTVSYNTVSDEYEVESLTGGLLTGASNIVYIEPVSHNGDTVYLLLDAAVSPVGTVKKASASFLITLSLILVPIALLLANLIAKFIARPIGMIAEEAKNLSEARYSSVDTHSRELEALNASLVTAANDLKQVEHLRSELIANLSHDLRTPLTLIGGYAEMMRDLPTEITEENLTVIVDETRRLTSLVNDMMDISLLENGKCRPHPITFSLTREIENTLSHYREFLKKDGYVFRFIGEADAVITADKAMILQVITNLLNNAMTYTGEDLSVTVTQILQEGFVRIEVSDTGIGIDPEKLPLIWDRYYKVDDAHKRAAKGTGLGLSIVRQVITMHDGRYGVRSTKDKGSTFWFELPLTPVLPSGTDVPSLPVSP